MYHTHFGLQRALFGDGIAADTTVFRSARHDELIANFKLALGSPSSAIVLCGPAGVGKTTLTSAALRASTTRIALAWLNATPANTAELLELVLVELGVAMTRTTRIERIQLWRQTQAEMRATESRLFVVVERTEDLSTDMLHALDSLTAADAAGNLGANVVLLGHAGMHEHLAAPVLESLRQRIRLRAELAPFTEAQLHEYLRHHVTCAGGLYDRVFAPDAASALFRHSCGVARLANTLCATALELAANEHQKLLTAELVARTAVSLLGLSAPAPSAATPRAPASPPAPGGALAPPPLATTTPAMTPGIAAKAAITHPAAVKPAARQPDLAPQAAPAKPAAPVAPPAAAPMSATIPSPVAKPAPVAFEFDGSSTDIADVALADFPVLTDAVEASGDEIPVAATVAAPATPPRVERVASASGAAASGAAAPASPRSALPQPAPASASTAAPPRIETAYAGGAKPAPATKAAAVKLPAPPQTAAAVKLPAPPPAAPALPPVDPDDDDQLRQTQTMRAIAVARSIDDISSSMAETLFGDAELDLVHAALKSAAADSGSDELSGDEQSGNAQSGNAHASDSTLLAPAPTPDDDPFDLFGLGDDAPLELIDDSTLPPADKARRTAVR